MNKIEEIQKLKSLLDQGAISQVEFDSLKKNILSSGAQANESIPNENINATYQENIFDENAGNIKKNENLKTTSKTYNKKTVNKSNSTEWESGDGATSGLLKVCFLLSIIMGAYVGDKYGSFITFLIFAGLSIAVAKAIPKLTPRLTHKNLLLGVQTIALISLVIYFNKDYSTSSTYSSKSPSSVFQSGSSSSSSSSYSSSTRTCSWCGKSYSGNGYYHLGNDCVEGDKNLGAGNMCSTRCCQEEWLTDPSNPNYR